MWTKTNDKSRAPFCVGMEPTPEELAEVEARKAAIRAEHLESLRKSKTKFTGGGRHALTEEDHEQERKRLEMLETTKPESKPEAAADNGRCPKCARPYGQRKRCYACPLAIVNGKAVNPKPKSEEAPKPVAAEKSPGPKPSVNGNGHAPKPVLRFDLAELDPLESAAAELDAMRAVVEAIRGLPESSRRRVRGYLRELLGD